MYDLMLQSDGRKRLEQLNGADIPLRGTALRLPPWSCKITTIKRAARKSESSSEKTKLFIQRKKCRYFPQVGGADHLVPVSPKGET